MTIFVDQSGKVEYTSKHTVVAFSNGRRKSLLIKATDKRELEKVFRDAGKPQIFSYKTFAILIFLLIKDDLGKITEIQIDKEYLGKDDLIKNFLMTLLRKHNSRLRREDISFCFVGKKSGCHKEAINVFRNRKVPDLVVTVRDVLKHAL